MSISDIPQGIFFISKLIHTMENLKHFSPPVMFSENTTDTKRYAKPEFQVLPLNIEAPLLSGSNQPTSKKLPINPVAPGGVW